MGFVSENSGCLNLACCQFDNKELQKDKNESKLVHNEPPSNHVWSRDSSSKKRRCLKDSHVVSENKTFSA